MVSNTFPKSASYNEVKTYHNNDSLSPLQKPNFFDYSSDFIIINVLKVDSYFVKILNFPLLGDAFFLVGSTYI